MKSPKFYRCTNCGEMVGIVSESIGKTMCCGRVMQRLVPNTTDGATEKHVPVIKRDGNKVHVEIGSAAHPMEEKHYIQWIAVAQDGRFQRVELAPGDKPEADFDVVDGAIEVYEYCNLYGLWQAKED